jgi:serine/threonine protein kinase
MATAMVHFGLCDSKATINEDTTRLIFMQVLRALAHVHAKQMAHRDLKAENIIFDSEAGEVVLIDFGFACVAKEKLKVFCGTPSYMSPEIVGKREYIGSAVDMWASGVLLYNMLFGIMPFKAANERELFRKIQRGHVSLPANSLVSDGAKDLLKSLLNTD